jgi:hypothetical protein
LPDARLFFNVLCVLLFSPFSSYFALALVHISNDPYRKKNVKGGSLARVLRENVPRPQRG